MTSLPLRARRAVVSGAHSARDRAAALHVPSLHVPSQVSGTVTAVRRRAGELDVDAVRAVVRRRSAAPSV